MVQFLKTLNCFWLRKSRAAHRACTLALALHCTTFLVPASDVTNLETVYLPANGNRTLQSAHLAILAAQRDELPVACCVSAWQLQIPSLACCSTHAALCIRLQEWILDSACARPSVCAVTALRFHAADASSADLSHQEWRMCVFATRVSKQSDDTRAQTQTSNTLRNTRIAAATLQHARQAWQQQRRASRLAACSREQITHRRTVSTMKLELPDVNREHADLRNLAHAKVPLICASRPNRACVEQYVAANGVETKQQCTQRSTTIDSPLLRALQTDNASFHQHALDLRQDLAVRSREAAPTPASLGSFQRRSTSERSQSLAGGEVIRARRQAMRAGSLAVDDAGADALDQKSEFVVGPALAPL